MENNVFIKGCMQVNKRDPADNRPIKNGEYPSQELLRTPIKSNIQNTLIIKSDAIRRKLLQLKCLMEDHLQDAYYVPEHHFGYFLREYIDRLGISRKGFAESIGLLPTELSQIINRHRRPKDKLAFRLELHSNGSFPALLWFDIIQLDRKYDLFKDSYMLNKERAAVKTAVMIGL